jgi:cohesin complex subunit SA-1/2
MTRTDALLKFPVNHHGNTQAFKHLLDLHVLFAAPDPQSDIVLPMASVSLTLDDEVQYRCVGYIQAEIERYAESLGSGAAKEGVEGEKDSDAEESSDGEQADEAVKAKRAKGKKTLKEGSLGFLIQFSQVGKESDGSCCISVDASSRTLLEEEYLFMDVMSTFLRAIRAGAIHIRHGATLIAHYGRLGPAFDICSKVIVDVLRDEGMVNNNGEIVVSVLTHALEEVRWFLYIM